MTERLWQLAEKLSKHGLIKYVRNGSNASLALSLSRGVERNRASGQPDKRHHAFSAGRFALFYDIPAATPAQPTG